MSLSSYSKIYHIGHRSAARLFDGEVTIEEKVDGSQFSFGVFNGELRARSKGKELVLDAPDKMFAKAVEVIRDREKALPEGHVFRGEYFMRPKHNALAYDRVPRDHIMIFDIDVGTEDYMPYPEKRAMADALGFETVPLMHEGEVRDVATLKSLLERVSILGGQKIEGFVVKNYERVDINTGKVLMGKYVSESFKEVNKANWKLSNPGKKDVLATLGAMYCTEARWRKALQHLAERGELTGSPKDIGPLIKEVQKDIAEECGQEIRDYLYKWAAPNIARAAVARLPEWYKGYLMESAFEKDADLEKPGQEQQARQDSKA